MASQKEEHLIKITGSARIKDDVLFAPLSLALKQAQWTCLLGASGVGKSTLLRLIAGLETHVSFSGNIESFDDQPIAPRIAYMAQDDLLMPWATVLNNVTIGAKLRGQKADQNLAKKILDRVGLTHHLDKKPHELSGGQRQRVALARTLMEEKEIILLDEPFSALDAKTRSEMQDLAVELLHQKTVLLVTHDPSEAARLGHDILVMTQNELRKMEVPSSPIPRQVDDLKTLQAQGNLLKFLRQAS